MNTSMLVRFGIMMFLQYAVWGAWFSVLSAALENMGFSGIQIGSIYGIIPLACIISPFIGGQIADRYLNTEKFLGIAHLIGAALMWLLSYQSEFSNLYWIMLIYSLLFAPTLPLTNSITFHHLTSVERQFGPIRVAGTIGWIAAGAGIDQWRRLLGLYPGDCFQLAAVLSLLLGLFCFALPKTPPNKESASPWAFLEAIRLLQNKVFLVFILISFVVATELQFYYVLTGPFLISIGIPEANLGTTMALAQVAEILVMLVFLPWLLPRIGVRNSLALGILAWPIRYAIFCVGHPTWLVIASLTLHGFCYVFFFTVGQIYVDEVAPKDTRGSAQSLHAFVTLGLGLFLGSLFCGWIRDLFIESTEVAGQMVPSVNYFHVFLVPCVLTIVCAAAFLMTFREPVKKAEV
ncbi:MAG TPA: MFS transporter [bacterium]|nr:MFS transporter [bacterium]